MMENIETSRTKRAYATKANKPSHKFYSNICEADFSLKIQERRTERMKPESPIKITVAPAVQASHHSILDKIPFLKERGYCKSIEQRMKSNEKLPLTQSCVEETSPTNINLDTVEKVVTKLRSMRYKNMAHNNSDDLYADTSSQEKRENEETRIKSKSLLENRTNYLKEHKLGTEENSFFKYLQPQNYQNTCIQRTQSKTCYEYSREYICEVKPTESDEEDDIIFSEEIGENSSKMIPLRQNIHQTKTTLQLLKINSDKFRDHSEFKETKTQENVSSLEDNYQKLIKYEPFSNQVTNRYIPIRQESPKLYQNHTSGDFSCEFITHDENTLHIPNMNTYSKTTVHRKRNREPYNPYGNDQERDKRVESERLNSFNDNYNNANSLQSRVSDQQQLPSNQSRHPASFANLQDVRSYYRNAYLNETEESSKRAIVNMQRSDRYNQRNQEQSESCQDLQIEYRIDTEANRYERYNPNNFNHGERSYNDMSLHFDRRKIGYENYCRY